MIKFIKSIKNKVLAFFVLCSINANAQTPSLTEQAEGIVQTAADEWGAIRNEDDPTTIRGGINAIIDAEFGTIAGYADNALDFYNESNTFSQTDCTADFSVSNDVFATAACRGNEECEDKYTAAVDKMNGARMALERISCIYNSTKNYTNSAIAFGDQFSGMHSMSSLAWQKEKANITKTFNNLKQTYDTKYTEFIKLLKDGLIEFDRAEAVYSQPGWFQRSGFIYFEMMKTRYKRND